MESSDSNQPQSSTDITGRQTTSSLANNSTSALARQNSYNSNYGYPSSSYSSSYSPYGMSRNYSSYGGYGGYGSSYGSSYGSYGGMSGGYGYSNQYSRPMNPAENQPPQPDINFRQDVWGILNGFHALINILYAGTGIYQFGGKFVKMAFKAIKFICSKAFRALVKVTGLTFMMKFLKTVKNNPDWTQEFDTNLDAVWSSAKTQNGLKASKILNVLRGLAFIGSVAAFFLGRRVTNEPEFPVEPKDSAIEEVKENNNPEQMSQKEPDYFEISTEKLHEDSELDRSQTSEEEEHENGKFLKFYEELQSKFPASTAPSTTTSVLSSQAPNVISNDKIDPLPQLKRHMTSPLAPSNKTFEQVYNRTEDKKEIVTPLDLVEIDTPVKIEKSKSEAPEDKKAAEDFWPPKDQVLAKVVTKDMTIYKPDPIIEKPSMLVGKTPTDKTKIWMKRKTAPVLPAVEEVKKETPLDVTPEETKPVEQEIKSEVAKTNSMDVPDMGNNTTTSIAV